LKVEVNYYGAFREFTGKRSEPLETSNGITVAGIREQIRGIYPKIAAKDEVLVAVNGSFEPLDRVIVEGDVVAFFPPVSGG